MASIETPKTKKKSKSSKTSEAAAGSRTVKSASVKKGSSGSQAAPIPTQANEKASSQSQQNESSDYSLSTESRKGSAETHFSRKTSGSVKSGFSMAASILSVKSALSAFLNPKGVSADAESEDSQSPYKSRGLFRRKLRTQCTVEGTDMEAFYAVSSPIYPYRYNRTMKLGPDLEFHAALNFFYTTLSEYHESMGRFIEMTRNWSQSLSDPNLKGAFEQIEIALTDVIAETRVLKASLDRDPDALGIPGDDGQIFSDYATKLFGDNGLYDQIRRADPQELVLEHSITCRRTPTDQCDAELGMRINSLDRVTSVVDEVYAKFGVVDTFEAIVSYENSLEIFHCYAPNGKMDDKCRYPDYKTVNTCLTVPRLELNSPLPVSPKIFFRAVFVDGDKNSHKKGIFKILQNEVKVVSDSVHGGANVVVAPTKMKKRYLEVTLFNDTLIVCKVDTRSPMERRLLFPPMPLTDVTATVLPGLNNSIDVIVSAENILRIVELEAGQRDKFFETFSRLKDAMDSHKEPCDNWDLFKKVSVKQIMPVETQGSPVNVFENQNALTVLSADGKSLSQMVTTRPLATQKLASFKCGVKRWDLGQEDTAECTSMGKLLFCMHTDNEFMFVTLSVPSTGAIIVSDNVGPLTQPRWSQSSGVLRVCLFNRLNHLAVYDLTFDDANASEMCRSLVCKAESMWARKLAKTRLPGTSIEAMPEIVEDLGLPLVPQEAQEFMIYPDGFECDESKSWNPVNDQLEIKFLGNYSNALLKVQENGGQLVLGPVSVIICLRGHSGNTLSARFVATSSLDAGNTDFLNIDLAAINSVFVDTRASSGNMIVLQLPSRDMSLTFYNESANNQNWTQPSLFEWVDIVNQAQSRILSGNAFVARRRAHILEVENLINDAKTRRTLWLEEQLAIAEAKEEEATAEVEDAAIEVAGLKGASTAADGQHVGESSQAENVVAVATKEETLPEKAINAAEDVYSLQTTQEDLLKEADYKNKWNKDNEASAVTLTEEDMADSTEASQKKMRGSKSTKTASSSKKGRRDSTAQSTATTGRRGDDDDDREDENADPKVKVISLTERLEQQLERVTAAQAETAALESTFIELCVQNRRIREFNVA